MVRRREQFINYTGFDAFGRTSRRVNRDESAEWQSHMRFANYADHLHASQCERMGRNAKRKTRMISKPIRKCHKFENRQNQKAAIKSRFHKFSSRNRRCETVYRAFKCWWCWALCSLFVGICGDTVIVVMDYGRFNRWLILYRSRSVGRVDYENYMNCEIQTGGGLHVAIIWMACMLRPSWPYQRSANCMQQHSLITEMNE